MLIDEGKNRSRLTEKKARKFVDLEAGLSSSKSKNCRLLGV